jgi:hypothetical protein
MEPTQTPGPTTRQDVLDERKQAIAATTVEVGPTFNNQFEF